MTHIDVMTIQDLWKENIDGYFPYLLEIYNPDIAWSAEEQNLYYQENAYLRLINDDNKVVFRNKTYLPMAFTYTPPYSDGTKISTASLTITAIDYRIRKMLRSIKLPSEAKLMAFYVKVTKENEQAKPVYKFKELELMPFTMDFASSDKTTAKFTLNFDRSMAQNVPFHIATQDRVPASRG